MRCSRPLARPRRPRRPLSSLPEGAAPFGVAVDPLTGAIYVANSGTNNVSVISDQTNTITTTINLPEGSSVPFGVAADALTGAVYVTDEESNNVSVITFTACATTITGTDSGPLTIGPGSTGVEPGAVITGPVTVTAGAEVFIQGATLQGPLSVKARRSWRRCAGRPSKAPWRWKTRPGQYCSAAPSLDRHARATPSAATSS